MSSASRSVVLAFAIGLGLAVAYVLRRPLLLIYISVVFAVVLSPAARRVQQLRLGKWQPSRGAAILILFAGVLLLLFIFFFFALPPIVRDVQDFAGEWPRHQARLTHWLKQAPFGDRLNFQMLERHAGDLIGGISGFLTDVAGVIFTLATVLVLVAYLVADGPRTFGWTMSLFPPETRERLVPALRHGAARMRSWILGQAILMLVLGSSSALVLGLIGVRYYYVLAVLAGIANIIPLIGPVVTVVLASLIAVIDSWGKLLGVLIFFAAYQQVENAFLTPHIMQTQVKLSPVAVLVAILLGGKLAGVLGALVAVPTAALISVLIDEYVMYRDTHVKRISRE